MIIPSIGMASPFLTTTISLTFTNSTFFITSNPFFTTHAVFGAKSISFVIEAVVFFLDIFSKYLPNDTNTKIIPADSKYRFILYLSTRV